MKRTIELTPESAGLVRAMIADAIARKRYDWSFTEQRDLQDALDAFDKAERASAAEELAR